MAGGLARTTAFWPVRPTLKRHSCRASGWVAGFGAAAPARSKARRDCGRRAVPAISREARRSGADHQPSGSRIRARRREVLRDITDLSLPAPGSAAFGRTRADAYYNAQPVDGFGQPFARSILIETLTWFGEPREESSAPRFRLSALRALKAMQSSTSPSLDSSIDGGSPAIPFDLHACLAAIQATRLVSASL